MCLQVQQIEASFLQVFETVVVGSAVVDLVVAAAAVVVVVVVVAFDLVASYQAGPGFGVVLDWAAGNNRNLEQCP